LAQIFTLFQHTNCHTISHICIQFQTICSCNHGSHHYS